MRANGLAKGLMVALVAVQAGLGWVALNGDSSVAASPKMPITPVATPSEPLTIEAAVVMADPVARRWADGAQLISAFMEVLWPNDVGEGVVAPSELPGGGAVTLVYASGGGQLTLLIDRTSGVIFHAEAGDWSDELDVPLPVGSVQRSSAIAVLAAEVSYGTGYRAACPEFRNVTRVYLAPAVGPDGHPDWLVSYADERHRDQPDIQLRVDAVTGTTVSGQATNLGCGDE